MLSYDDIKLLFNYCPENGYLTRRVKRGRMLSGSRAGFIRERGYRKIHVNGKEYYEHRIIFCYMTGEYPQGEIDHINRNKSDNRWRNLREVTKAENGKNKIMRSDNSSGITGVNWLEQKGKWRAYIGINKKIIHLGLFENINDAILARKEAQIKYGFTKGHGTMAP